MRAAITLTVALAAAYLFGSIDAYSMRLEHRRSFVEERDSPYYKRYIASGMSSSNNLQHPHSNTTKLIRESGNDTPVAGNIYPIGIFYFFLDLGTPSRTFPVAIDSGSQDFIIPAAGCNGCHLQKPNNVYDWRSSSTSSNTTCEDINCNLCSNNQCFFSNTYETCNLTDPTAPCTISGPVFHDIVRVGDLEAHVDFGAITYQTTNFEQFYIVDGLVGFIGTIGAFGETTVIASMYEQGAIKENSFAMCLRPNAQKGVLTFGTPDMSLASGAVQWTPMTDQFFYAMQVTSIDVNGADSGIPNYQEVIIDSGTNVLLLPTEFFNTMRSFMLDHCSSLDLKGTCNTGTGPNLWNRDCIKLTAAQQAMYPKVSLNLGGGGVLSFSGAQLFYTNKLGEQCLAIKSTTPGGLYIVGDVIMQNYYTIFDRANHRLGWAPVNVNACEGK